MPRAQASQGAAVAQTDTGHGARAAAAEVATHGGRPGAGAGAGRGERSAVEEVGKPGVAPVPAPGARASPAPAPSTGSPGTAKAPASVQPVAPLPARLASRVTRPPSGMGAFSVLAGLDEDGEAVDSDEQEDSDEAGAQAKGGKGKARKGGRGKGKAIELDWSDPDTLLGAAGLVLGVAMGLGAPIWYINRTERDEKRLEELRAMNRANYEATGEYMKDEEIAAVRKPRWTDRREWADDD
ncbi:hypothetical protein QJQ45_014882 [Haematococcus lacustris]|nr:hypothetical protein QJQ45_014882 [Haematococcus lacustris]